MKRNLSKHILLAGSIFGAMLSMSAEDAYANTRYYNSNAGHPSVEVNLGALNQMPAAAPRGYPDPYQNSYYRAPAPAPSVDSSSYYYSDHAPVPALAPMAAPPYPQQPPRYRAPVEAAPLHAPAGYGNPNMMPQHLAPMPGDTPEQDYWQMPPINEEDNLLAPIGAAVSPERLDPVPLPKPAPVAFPATAQAPVVTMDPAPVPPTPPKMSPSFLDVIENSVDILAGPQANAGAVPELNIPFMPSSQTAELPPVIDTVPTETITIALPDPVSAIPVVPVPTAPVMNATPPVINIVMPAPNVAPAVPAAPSEQKANVSTAVLATPLAAPAPAMPQQPVVAQPVAAQPVIAQPIITAATAPEPAPMPQPTPAAPQIAILQSAPEIDVQVVPSAQPAPKTASIDLSKAISVVPAGKVQVSTPVKEEIVSIETIGLAETPSPKAEMLAETDPLSNSMISKVSMPIGREAAPPQLNIAPVITAMAEQQPTAPMVMVSVNPPIPATAPAPAVAPPPVSVILDPLSADGSLPPELASFIDSELAAIPDAPDINTATSSSIDIADAQPEQFDKILPSEIVWNASEMKIETLAPGDILNTSVAPSSEKAAPILTPAEPVNIVPGYQSIETEIAAISATAKDIPSSDSSETEAAPAAAVVAAPVDTVTITEIQPAASAPAKSPEARPETAVAPEVAAEAPAFELASLPALSDMSLVFEGASSALSQNLVMQLDPVIEKLKSESQLRLQLRSYAGSADGSESSARRVSLARAIEIRKYLLEQGIDATRIDVRALGDETDKLPVNRTDMIYIN